MEGLKVLFFVLAKPKKKLVLQRVTCSCIVELEEKLRNFLRVSFQTGLLKQCIILGTVFC
jgi:hypothetical protein